MTSADRTSLLDEARAVLERNRRGAWTCPSAELYPHLWLWDSCLIAIGVARYDAPRAAEELRSVFRGQWTNGMLPHMIFADDVPDVGSRRLWQSRHNAQAPRDVDTSCITQPPLPAVAAWAVAQALPTSARRELLADLLPRIVAYHQWLYRERDLANRGLVTLIHPWECGLDTTPPWMRQLAQFHGPWWMRIALAWHLARLVRFVRRDTRYVPASERPSDDDGLRMLALARSAKRYDFELRRMPRRDSVLVEDLAFNAILVVANRAVAEIAADLGVPVDPGLAASAAATEAALDTLWDEARGQYFSRDAATGDPIPLSTVATFLPLWAAVPEHRARRLVELLCDGAAFWPSVPVPSVPVDAPEFEPDRYWKGPTWINMNWMVVQGLLRCGEPTLAEDLRGATVELVGRTGFSEYFSPLTGRGFGAEEFSWTAALTIDLLRGAPPGAEGTGPAQP
ncbi:MAG TPA: trehalase family glycosidase [Acidimicrobiia bacterium]|nr:trehalase family glycosidase [Acidimicrobiia bacterium]